MTYLGIGIILFLVIIGWLFLVKDIAKKNSNFNRHIIPFKDGYDTSNLPLVQLKLNGKYEWFLVDSGATINLIKQSYFDSLENKPETIENKEEIYTGNNSMKSLFCIMNLKYKSTKFNNEIFNIAQLNVFDFKKDEYKRDIVGIIGSPFFEKYKWTICYDKMQICFNK